MSNKSDVARSAHAIISPWAAPAREAAEHASQVVAHLSPARQRAARRRRITLWIGVAALIGGAAAVARVVASRSTVVPPVAPHPPRVSDVPSNGAPSSTGTGSSADTATAANPDQ